MALCFSAARADRTVCGQSPPDGHAGFPRTLYITLLWHSPRGWRLAGKFLEVESLGFCKEKVPPGAAAWVPLFSRGRGTPGERAPWAPQFFLSIWLRGLPRASRGASCHLVPGREQSSTPSCPRSWRGGAPEAGLAGLGSVGEEESGAGQEARSWKLSPDHHLGRTSRL